MFSIVIFYTQLIIIYILVISMLELNNHESIRYLINDRFDLYRKYYVLQFEKHSY